MRKRLGEILVEKGLITPEALREALDIQTRTGERLGRILLALGYVRRLDLYKVLSEAWGLPFILLNATPPDPVLARRWPLEEALQHRAVPVRIQDGVLWVAVANYPSPDPKRALARHFGPIPKRYFVTTEWDIDWAIRKLYRDALIKEATYGLYLRSPDESAYTVFTPAQYLALSLSVLALLIGFYFYPLSTGILLNALANLFFSASILFKFATSLAGALAEGWTPITEKEIKSLKEAELPYYTILVPLYREANVVGLLMQNLAKLDYPKEKLEILLLIEEDDPETLAAAQNANPPENVKFIIIPDALPKTKPKACNVGLSFARGEYLVIYDAEDQPEPDQLKKAVVAFKKGPPHMVCVQAALNFFNWNENFLTRMFTLEYSYWFDYMLPGLYHLDLPIPLGGTSNHFRTDKLRELGGWDPFNVTEDADLGIRAAMRGYTVGVINSTTYEEANNRVGNWIRQRSRWIKGYMQTALVHSRHPLVFLKEAGLRQFLGFFLLIGGTPLTFLLAPLFWGMLFYWLLTKTLALDPLFPPWILYLSLFNLLWGNALAIYLNMLAVFKRRLYSLTPYALLNPLYWILHSIAAYKALWQLFTNPFYWEKTLHGLTQAYALDQKRPQPQA